VKWHAGQLSWAQAIRESRIRLDGPSWLVRAFPTWNGRSMFAHIKPDAGSVTRVLMPEPAIGRWPVQKAAVAGNAAAGK
jgi:hypothetical protein